MSTNPPLNQLQLCLPNIYSIESSEQAFSEAFLRAAQILDEHLKQIKSAIEVIKDFKKEPFNLAILGLFAKICSHYYTCTLLEVHQDRIGSQFLTEHLCEAAITLAYLLEEADNSLLPDYISASVHQAHYLLVDVEEQLQNLPNHPDLLILRDKLEAFISKQQQYVVDHPLTAYSEVYSWGPQEANTTAKRGAVIGLDFLTNPARKVALKIMPASWLELQLDYLNSLNKSSRIATKNTINFTSLRDTAHLCLHATQIFLEEVIEHQKVDLPELESRQLIFNMLYEWFHNAHNTYQQNFSATVQERDGL